jgi:serine/threonine protein kinase
MEFVTRCPCCDHVLIQHMAECPICGCDLTSPPQVAGRLLRNGAYRLGRQLDRGGMANVYWGEITRTGQPCVVKELREAGSQQQRVAFEALFTEEARVLGRLSRAHAAIPRYYDSFMDSGTFYIVLEFVPGQNLDQYIRERTGHLPIGEVLDHIRQVVDVLMVLHELHPDPVSHGDIKPSNLVRRPDGQVVLIDFGLARVNVPLPAYIPVRPTAHGTPGYTPLEQWMAHPTPAADIFALGATMHHLISGRDPRTAFATQATVNLTDLRMLTTFPPLASLVPEISPALDGLILQMLSRRPADRPPARILKARLAGLRG